MKISCRFITGDREATVGFVLLAFCLIKLPGPVVGCMQHGNIFIRPTCASGEVRKYAILI